MDYKHWGVNIFWSVGGVKKIYKKGCFIVGVSNGLLIRRPVWKQMPLHQLSSVFTTTTPVPYTCTPSHTQEMSVGCHIWTRTFRCTPPSTLLYVCCCCSGKLAASPDFVLPMHFTCYSVQWHLRKLRSSNRQFLLNDSTGVEQWPRIWANFDYFP